MTKLSEHIQESVKAAWGLINIIQKESRYSFNEKIC
jgi:hypothetical protein